ncbi:hypothetical protein [Micromonospora sp. NPDC049900]|uniref:hypothetical protein n=1 Tax=unclassified Micromonospora TaxID=2617518 RepID=UPI0037B2D448
MSPTTWAGGKIPPSRVSMRKGTALRRRLAVVFVTVLSLLLGSAVVARADDTGDWDPQQARDRLFSLHMRIHDRGQQGIQDMIVSAALRDWRASHPQATAAQLRDMIIRFNTAVSNEYAGMPSTESTAYSYVIKGIEAISGLPGVSFVAPALRVLLESTWGDQLASEQLYRHQVTGAYQNYLYLERFYTVQDREWGEITRLGQQDPAFAEAWDGFIGARVGIRLNATWGEMLADPLLASFINAEALNQMMSQQRASTTELLDMARQGFARINADTEALREELARMSVKYPVGPGPKPTPADYTRALSEAEDRQVAIDGAGAALNFVATLIGFADKKAAKEISTVGGAALTIATAINEYIPKVAGLDVFEALSSIGTAALAGNLLGAAMSLTSVFFGSGPSPEQMILDQIAAMRQEMRELGTRMEVRFDAIEQALVVIFDEMLVQFDRLRGDIRDVRARLDSIQSILLGLDAKVSALAVSTHAAFEENAMHDFKLQAETYLGYEAKSGRPLDNFDFYWPAVSAFFHYGKEKSAASGLAVTTKDVGSLGVDGVRTHTPNGSMLLLARLARGYDPQFPMPTVQTGFGVPNAGVWSAASRAYIAMTEQNAAFARTGTPQRAIDLQNTGQDILTVARSFSGPTEAGGTNTLFTKLTQSYGTDLTALTGALGDIRKEVGMNGRYDPFGHANQAPPGRVAAVDTMRTCATNARPLPVPSNGVTANLPHSYHTAYTLLPQAAQPSFKTCFDAVYENQEYYEAGYETGTTADVRVTIRLHVQWPGGEWREARRLVHVGSAGKVEWYNSKTGSGRSIAPDEAVSNLWASGLRTGVERHAQISNVAASEDDAWLRATAALHGRQKYYYQRVLTDLNSPATPLARAYTKLNDTLLLLQAYSQVGWAKALRTNETLNSLLFGGQHLPGAFTLPGTGDSDHLAEAMAGALKAYDACRPETLGGACAYNDWFSPRGHAPAQFGVDCPAVTVPEMPGDPVGDCVAIQATQRLAALQEQYRVQSQRLKAGDYVEGPPEIEEVISHLKVSDALLRR